MILCKEGALSIPSEEDGLQNDVFHDEDINWMRIGSRSYTLKLDACPIYETYDQCNQEKCRIVHGSRMLVEEFGRDAFQIPLREHVGPHSEIVMIETLFLSA
jgi:hypothetical protein